MCKVSDKFVINAMLQDKIDSINHNPNKRYPFVSQKQQEINRKLIDYKTKNYKRIFTSNNKIHSRPILSICHMSKAISIISSLLDFEQWQNYQCWGYNLSNQ